MIKFGENISVVMITLNEENSVAKVINDIKKIDTLKKKISLIYQNLTLMTCCLSIVLIYSIKQV